MEDKPEISRQRKWQLRKKAEGKCELCGEPSAGGVHCEKHKKMNRIYYRSKYRLKKGIPLDAPMIKAGRPRLTDL
jgi:hypothetical protein